MRYEQPVYRPPSEAHSYILQITYGCTHNKCTYCDMYRGKDFRVRDEGEILEDIREAARLNPDTRRIFLADGDALSLPTDTLLRILDALHEEFPALNRVGIYYYGPNLRDKTVEELRVLREHGLGIAYLGLESGSEKVLKKVVKGCTAEEMITGSNLLTEAGIKLSVIVLLGLGGTDLWEEHARESAEAVTRINPRFLSTLTLSILPGTPIYRQVERGRFTLPEIPELMGELALFLENLEVTECVFRSNHASNYLPLSGRLPRDRDDLVDAARAAARGEVPLRPEWFRGL